MCLKLRLAHPHISRIVFALLFNPHTEIPDNYKVTLLREHKQKLFHFPLKSTADIWWADVSGRLKKAAILCSMPSKSLSIRIIFISLQLPPRRLRQYWSLRFLLSFLQWASNLCVDSEIPQMGPFPSQAHHSSRSTACHSGVTSAPQGRPQEQAGIEGSAGECIKADRILFFWQWLVHPTIQSVGCLIHRECLDSYEVLLQAVSE